MSIAICDDDLTDASRIQGLVRQYCRERPGVELEAVYFESGQALLDAVKEGQSFSLYLLDILLPEMSGIAIADRLAELRARAPVIFLTSSPEYALDAFRVRALNYLLKPIQAPDLFVALDEALASRTRPRPVLIPTEEGETAVPIDRIVYAECNIHRVRYHLSDGSVLLSRTLRVPFSQAVRPLLESNRFLQPHRSYVVNADYVLQLAGNSLTLMDEQSIPVSQLRMPEVRRQYMDMMLEH